MRWINETTNLLAASGLDVSSLLALLTPIVIVPLGVITFYLRALREQQSSGAADLTRRIESNEQALQRLGARLGDLQGDFATKEDWLRECMLARRDIARLSEALTRTQTEMELLLKRRTGVAAPDLGALTESPPYEGTD